MLNVVMNRRTVGPMIEGDAGIHVLLARKSSKLFARHDVHLCPFAAGTTSAILFSASLRAAVSKWM
jgi:hypothetical protein